MHELYCAGHFIQAAFTHFRVPGGERLLNCALRLADHICRRFGRQESGKQPGTSGHEVIEMALVELWRTTRDCFQDKQSIQNKEKNWNDRQTSIP